ncbi:hypothetical protein G7054_g11651 [Neopestalotiopsis clavispora]|nr:hypothetical protein G7054_g11651 [Neopestalotiopsis clavispora]
MVGVYSASLVGNPPVLGNVDDVFWIIAKHGFTSGSSPLEVSAGPVSASREAVNTFPGGLYFTVISLGAMVLLGYLSYKVAQQKNWVKDSGWIKLKDGRNTEEYVATLGQLIALCQFPISILGCAKVAWEVYTEIHTTWEDPKPPSEDVEMDDLQTSPSTANNDTSSNVEDPVTLSNAQDPVPLDQFVPHLQSRPPPPTNHLSSVTPINPTSMLDP